MKKVLLALILCNFIIGCSTKNSGYNIQGKINELNNCEIKLYEYKDSKLICIDSTISKNGMFSFTGQSSVPSQHYLRIEGASEYVKFFLENAEINLDIDINNPTKVIVEGSQTESQFQHFLKENYEKHQKRINEVIDSLEALPYDIDSYSKGELVLDPLYEKQKPFFKQYLLENNNSPVSPLIINEYTFNRFSFEENKMIYENFTDLVKSTEEAKYLKSRLDKLERTAIGKPAPVFIMNDTSGNPISIAGFKGKYLLVDFWASWCAPCRVENKHLLKIYEKFKDSNFEILGVSFDSDKKAWIKAINMDSTTWTQISELNGMNNQAKELYDNTLPGSVLINKEGIIIAKNLKHDELAVKLAEILEKH